MTYCYTIWRKFVEICAFNKFCLIFAVNMLSNYVSRLCPQNELNAVKIDANLLAISDQTYCQSNGILRTVCLPSTLCQKFKFFRIVHTFSSRNLQKYNTIYVHRKMNMHKWNICISTNNKYFFFQRSSLKIKYLWFSI